VIKSLLKAVVPKKILSTLQSAHLAMKSGLAFKSSLLERFDIWFPHSSNWFLYPDLTIKNANSYPLTLFHLQQAVSSKKPEEIEILDSKSFGKLNCEFTKTLSDLFGRHGSDKATKHDYFLVYADLLSELGLNRNLKILEIGLGSNNPDLVSSMGAEGKPGASLRAFRDSLPSSEIYGADIDRSILFAEERIKTAWVDQFDRGSFVKMAEDLGETQFDLIIDDGLHAITANLNSLMFALNSLREGGIMIVEDIPKRTTDAWFPVIATLSDNYDCRFIRCKCEYLFFLRKKSSHGINKDISDA
jgi:hypothetical protein